MIQTPITICVTFDDKTTAELPSTTRCTNWAAVPQSFLREGDLPGWVVLLSTENGACEAIPWHAWPISGWHGKRVLIETTEQDEQGGMLWKPALVESWEDYAGRVERLLVQARQRYQILLGMLDPSGETTARNLADRFGVENSAVVGLAIEVGFYVLAQLPIETVKAKGGLTCPAAEIPGRAWNTGSAFLDFMRSPVS